eukprot:229433-Chlamydomonas_euryale.AAC.1
MHLAASAPSAAMIKAKFCTCLRLLGDRSIAHLIKKRSRLAVGRHRWPAHLAQRARPKRSLGPLRVGFVSPAGRPRTAPNLV